jgi:hypothetical protein
MGCASRLMKARPKCWGPGRIVSDWHPHWAEAAAKGVNMPSHILKSGQTYQELMGCHARWVHNPENASL